MFRIGVVALLTLLQCGAEAGMVILGDTRTVHAFAVADNAVLMQHDEETQDDAAAAPGQWIGAVAAGAEAMFAAAFAEAFQDSDVSGGGVTFEGTVFASGYSEDPDSTVASESDSLLLVPFRLDSAQRLVISVQASAFDGASGGAVASFVLSGDGVPLYEYDALAGLPPLEVDEVFPTGQYEISIELSAEIALASLGGAGEKASIIASVLVAADCPGDANGDGVVDFLDLNHVLSDFGMTAPGLLGDLDGDGDCDFIDLNIVLSNFGAVC